MNTPKRPKKLAVLDLDNTLVDTLEVWGRSLDILINDFSVHYKVDKAIIYELIREAPGQYRFNDGVSLQDWMIDADPKLRQAHIRLNSDWEKAGNPIKRDWLANSAKHTVFYDGVLDTLKQWKETKTGVAIQTDAEDSAVLRRLWLLAKDATDKRQLASPEELLNLIGPVYCQQGSSHAGQFLEGVELSFMQALHQKMHKWDDRLYKPAASHLRKIVEDAGVGFSDVVYIGDTHKDIIEAKALSPQIDFAWACYGAQITPEVRDLYNEVGSKSYTYGHQEVQREMRNRGVEPDANLQHSFAELNKYYSWLPK